jgi:hypothetical protein
MVVKRIETYAGIINQEDKLPEEFFKPQCHDLFSGADEEQNKRLIIHGVAKAKTTFVSFVFDADPTTRSFTLTLKNESSRKALCYRRPVTLS